MISRLLFNNDADFRGSSKNSDKNRVPVLGSSGNFVWRRSPFTVYRWVVHCSFVHSSPLFRLQFAPPNAPIPNPQSPIPDPHEKRPQFPRPISLVSGLISQVSHLKSISSTQYNLPPTPIVGTILSRISGARRS